MKRVVKYIVYAFVVLLVINFGVKAYWKMKSYSFSAYLKDAWTYCHEKGLNEDYCLFVDFSRPSGEDRMALYDFKTQSMVYAAPCAHGNGKSNTAWRPKFSNEEGSHCSVTGHFKVGSEGYSPAVGRHFKLDGLDVGNSNARQRHIYIHASKYVGIAAMFTAYLPLTDASQGCFTTSETMLKKIEMISQKSEKPLLLYAYY
ncbi:murein L,D-transpeptidase catalytic domain-containing protein [Alloprevotella tannerae]|uniref:murein L,D-transpeptidase catalytic domain-containing protein n=1 Tax=Alloprevotella tannerae TaxID=76122 RepID=UPI0028EA5A16|nr:murein L,D-transpeptidase catalytic domain family protein [Alloprevotella tannerae]